MTATIRFRRRAAGAVADLGVGIRGGSRSPDDRQPDRDGEADGHRGERTASARYDGGPPGGQDQESGRQPDRERLPGRRIGREQPDEACHPDPEQQAHRTDQQALADGQPDRPIGQRDRELSEHRRTIPSGVRDAPQPESQGRRSTWVWPYVATGMASGTSVFGWTEST